MWIFGKDSQKIKKGQTEGPENNVYENCVI